jgi:hypothetical protein
MLFILAFTLISATFASPMRPSILGTLGVAAATCANGLCPSLPTRQTTPPSPSTLQRLSVDDVSQGGESLFSAEKDKTPGPHDKEIAIARAIIEGIKERQNLQSNGFKEWEQQYEEWAKEYRVKKKENKRLVVRPLMTNNS